MSKMPKTLVVCVSIVLVISLAGCASIVTGRFQAVTITAYPPATLVTVDGQQINTPCVVNLDTTKSKYVLRFEKEGYEPVEVKLERTLSGWLLGNIIFGPLVVIGIAVDFASSSAYKLKPKEVDAVLKAEGLSLKDIEGDAIVYVDMALLTE